MTQSMRGRRGRDHAPAALTYVGRLVVEKKPSGSTPSAGAGSKRASGAPASGGASKSGGRYWKRGRAVTLEDPLKLARTHSLPLAGGTRYRGRIASRNGPAQRDDRGSRPT